MTPIGVSLDLLALLETLGEIGSHNDNMNWKCDDDDEEASHDTAKLAILTDRCSAKRTKTIYHYQQLAVRSYEQ
eukprot:scaffold187_cov266-Chaetoceros_neogracile.AAC.71